MAASTGATARTEPAATAFLALSGVLLLGLLLRLFFFSGLSGSDETTYSVRALEAARGEYLYTTYVGSLRYGVNLPMAGFVRLFGANDVGLHAWPMLCSLGEVLLVFLLADRVWGRRTAVLAGLLLATAPLHIHAGGRALADAPLAFFVTLAMTAFVLAERNGSRLLYLLAGAAIGFSWWIKPHTIVFGAVLLVYAAITMRWNRAWHWVIAAFLATIAIEWLLFAHWFGDPFHGLRSMMGGIDKDFVKQDAPWGDHAPFFYFRQMFLDGRDFFLVPVFALAGLVLVLLRSPARGLQSGGYVALWAVGLVALFSFTPYSFSPFKLIPKQENYALIFLAPLALLGGYALASVSLVLARGALLGLGLLGGAALASLPQQQLSIRQATLAEATRLAYANIGVSYLPLHALNLIKVRALMGYGAPAPERFKPVQDLLDRRAAPSPVAAMPPGPQLAFAHPRWPEFIKLSAAEQARPLLDCPAPQRRPLPIDVVVPGVQVLDGLLWLRERLPAVAARQLGFAADMRRWAPLDVQGCGVAALASMAGR